MILRSTTVLSALLAAGCASGPGAPVPVTPQRPTVSSNTNTTYHGTFELEAGVFLDESDFFDTPLALKYGAGAETELFLTWSPYQRIDIPGPNGDGIGDLGVGVRHRVVEEDEGSPAAAFQLFTRLPTADESEGLSSGEIDFFAAAIVDKSFGELGTTGFYQLGVLGDPAGEDGDIEHTLALAAGAPFSERWGAFGELSAILVPEQDLDIYQLIGGATYTARPDLVFDAGLLIGLSKDAPDFALFVGLTHNFGGPASPGRRRQP